MYLSIGAHDVPSLHYLYSQNCCTRISPTQLRANFREATAYKAHRRAVLIIHNSATATYLLSATVLELLHVQPFQKFCDSYTRSRFFISNKMSHFTVSKRWGGAKQLFSRHQRHVFQLSSIFRLTETSNLAQKSTVGWRLIRKNMLFAVNWTQFCMTFKKW